MENQMQNVQKFNLRKIAKVISYVYFVAMIPAIFLVLFFGSFISNQWGIFDYFFVFITWATFVVTLIDLHKRPRSLIGFLGYGSSMFFIAAMFNITRFSEISQMLLVVLFGVFVTYGIVSIFVPFRSKNIDVNS